MSYAKAAHFDEVFDLYRSALDRSTLVEVNIALVDAFADYLGIETKRVHLRSSCPTSARRPS